MRSRKSCLVVLAACLCLRLDPAAADEIVFGFRPVPPYVMVDASQKLSGIEYEIIAAALSAAGHGIEPRVMPLARLVETFRTGGVQAAAPILPSTNSGGILSDVYLSYHNVAMTLRSSGFRLTKIADLKGLSIVAFQTATRALGPDFASVVQGNARYSEQALQIIQIRMLFNKRTDVVIGDSRILNYYVRSPEAAVDSALPVDEFGLFPPTNYRVAFSDPRHAADFNAGLASIRKSGAYSAIIAKYSAQ